MDNKNLIKETINKNIVDDSMILNNLKTNRKINPIKITAIASSIIFIIVSIALFFSFRKPDMKSSPSYPLREHKLTNEEVIEEVYMKFEEELNSFAKDQKFNIISISDRVNHEITDNYLYAEGAENESWVIYIENIVVDIEYKGIKQSVVFRIHSDISNVYTRHAVVLTVYNEIINSYLGYFNSIETDRAKINIYEGKIYFSNK